MSRFVRRNPMATGKSAGRKIDSQRKHHIKRSCEFFREKLGFSLVFSYGEPPYYAQVGRDAARLNLRYVEDPVIESTVRDREERLSVFMTAATADEIKLLFLEFQSAGVTFHQTLK